MTATLSDWFASTPLSGANAAFVEDLYERFLSDPEAVPAEWRALFRALPPGALERDVPHGPVRADFAARARGPRLGAGPAAAAGSESAAKQGVVSRMVQVYANRGHLLARIDPLGLMQRETPRVLELGYFGLTDADLDREFFTGSRSDAIPSRMKLRDMIAQLKFVYCDTIGAEFAHVSSSEERLWLQDTFQVSRLRHRFSAEERRNLLWQLTAAEGLERYLHTKYVGQKRFSLEGGDSLIPMLDDLVQHGGGRGVEECIIGMAHRGRLNVLVNLLGKAPSDLFSEFEGHYDLQGLKGSGDVKYHKGFSADLSTPAGNVHVALAFNPSHLEVVNPVVEGSVRARQERRGDVLGERVLPVLVHGDAAFAGQGVVMETLQLSQARGFYTGGTVHLVINNQVGFTTSDPRDARSTLYCSDVAKIVEAPIFHVNGDDPEACVFVTRLALDYRMKFRKDVVIDLVCYRRHGHNEADEPAATQPAMYQTIRKHPTPRQIYAARLAAEGALAAADAERMVEDYRSGLDAGKPQARAALGLIGNQYTVDWSAHLAADPSEEPATGVELAHLKELGARLVQFPADLALHPRVAKIYEERARMLAGEAPLDWGAAETLAYATLVDQGYGVRLTGQDSGRGTFFHRHAVLHDQASERIYTPLEHIGRGGRFRVTDSVLSEEAVLGFEYGFATTSPEVLVIWEGQFGDFVNGAQVIIDQFISSGEAKWGRLCGLTLLLPHGYEGQGPEHSSARLERFLQLCAEANMQVCVPSTPAQMFHMLRRQMVRPVRKPLIVMTPKSLLRHRLAVSELAELTGGHFRPVLDEIDPLERNAVRRVVFCSGKVYYDLLERRRADGLKDVALVRLERLYPFPAEEYAAVLAGYPNAHEIVWCQEEPQNQGAWYQIRHRLQEPLSTVDLLLYAGRAGAAAPAAGIHELHVQQQQLLVRNALSAPASDDTGRETLRLLAPRGAGGERPKTIRKSP
ncbi:MAG: 2-oxoglutarate dehydrogenase E1 component [Proteobacteria bacterium]|nr:2-oxoglutarate dehydrogenase E1 component [Pseudomonadota bacterium]